MLRPRRLVLGDEFAIAEHVVGAEAGAPVVRFAPAVRDVLVVVVRAGVVGADVEVVGLGRVPAPAVDRQREFGRERRFGEVHAVDVGADRVTFGRPVDGERGPRFGGREPRDGGGEDGTREHAEACRAAGAAPAVVRRARNTLHQNSFGAHAGRLEPGRQRSNTRLHLAGGSRRRTWAQVVLRRITSAAASAPSAATVMAVSRAPPTSPNDAPSPA